MSKLDQIQIGIGGYKKVIEASSYDNDLPIFDVAVNATRDLEKLLAIARAAEAHMNTFDIPLSMMRPTEIALREALAALEKDEA